MHEMELQLELTLSKNSSSRNLLQRNKEVMSKMSKKRSFGKAFDLDADEDEVNSIDVVPQTLPLFVWKVKDEDDDSNHKHSSLLHFNKINEEKENGVVGWPPIKSWRKNVRCHRGNGRGGCGGSGGGGLCENSMYVKVMMEGFGIGRKVDLSLHHSYETLTNTLMLMFEKYCNNGQRYRLTYQDKEGDWLLAGDVPWGSFIQTVQRLKLLKEWRPNP